LNLLEIFIEERIGNKKDEVSEKLETLEKTLLTGKNKGLIIKPKP